MNTLFVGQNIVRLHAVDSTNRFASDLLRSGSVHEGTLILTDIQTAGRGQRGRVWQSDPGKNLTCTLVLFPQFLKGDESFLLTKMVSVALQRLVSQFVDEEVFVKWPNDIYVGNRKISGILIENVWKNGAIWTSSIGMGLNVNQSVFDGVETATSLKIEANRFFQLEEVLGELCSLIESNYLRIKSNRHALDADYEAVLLGANTWRSYRVNGTMQQLRIDGVSPSGRLLVEDRQGAISKLDFQEVEFIL